jgi:hypothetical protein
VLCIFFQRPGNAQEAKPTSPEAPVEEMALADDWALKLALSAYDQGDARSAEPRLRGLPRGALERYALSGPIRCQLLEEQRHFSQRR